MSELKLRIVEKKWETSDACSFYFENVAGGTLFYKPGQFLTFLIKIDGQEVRRSYSLCTVPVKDKFPGVTVKRVDKGLVSNYLIDKLNVGDTVECLHPLGIFFPELALVNKKEYFLFAAGSGITPLYSILQTILLKEPNSVVNLVYVNRNESTIIYKSDLDSLELQFSDRLKVVYILSQASDSWLGFKGRLQEGLACDLIQELSEMDKKDTLFFLCGPKEFMEIGERAIKKMGYGSNTIKKEDFSSSAIQSTPSAAIGEEKVVKLIYRNQEHEFQLAAGQSILNGALENGIKLPYSCTSGVCTACIGICLEGEVDISSSDALSENEKKQGYVLTCIGKPITKSVTIQID